MRSPAVVLAALAALSTAAPAVADPLDAFAPVLVHDGRDRAPFASVAGARARVPGLPPRGGPEAYARAVPAPGGRRFIQYWLFSPDNPQDRGILRTGRHAGDWELVQVGLDRRGRPLEVVASQHSGAERCGWSDVRRDGTHPHVFVANGSHAGYFRPGVRDRMWPDPNDEARGDGLVVRPRVVPVTARSPRWMRWPGRWGASRAGAVPGEQDSPRGPAFQGVRWSDPAAFAASARACAVACRRVGACDGRERAVAAAALALTALGALAAAARVRRRRAAGR